ncbi:MAG: type II secretion system protein [Patescibacteria group bacterium]
MREKGFSLVEIIIAIGLVAVFLPAIGAIFSLSIFSASQGEKYSQAYALAQEQMEAVYFLKNKAGSSWDWISTPANTLIGEYYQPYQTNGIWQLGGKTVLPQETNGFNKKVEIFSVRRCGLAICEMGVLDDYSRKINVFVSWQEKGEVSEIKMESYVTHY